MQAAGSTVRLLAAIGIASLAAGCVQPDYVQPGPIQLQPYPPPVYYQSAPDYRPPVTGPIPLQPAPLVQPLPPPAPAPTVTDEPDDKTGAIPLQDLPPLAPDKPAPASDAAPAPTSPPPEIRKLPASGPGNNVPLEGFRPMKGTIRPAP